jgi:cytochrome bd-type quinol oxidase subunit 2
MKKKIITLLLLVAVLAPVFTLAQEEPPATTDGFGFGTQLDEVAQKSGFNPGNEMSLDERISSFIGIFLSFLGVIFLILMIYGGYNWMTAAGDEKKIDKAKDTIRAAIIGIIIIIAAYAISVFVVSRIWGATSASLFAPTVVYAQIDPPSGTASPMLDRLKGVGTGAGYGDANETSLMQVLGIVINGLLGLLGAIFIILMLLAGYRWMTASGDEEKINKAKDTIRASIIGLIIIVGAFAIWNFLATYLIGDGGQGGNLIN